MHPGNWPFYYYYIYIYYYYYYITAILIAIYKLYTCKKYIIIDTICLCLTLSTCDADQVFIMFVAAAKKNRLDPAVTSS